MIHWIYAFGLSSWQNICYWLSPPTDPYAWVAYLSTTFSALCYIPQIRRIRKTQSSKDISFWMFGLWILGSSAWITFGIRIQKMPIILPNLLNLVFRIWLISYKLIIDRKNLKKTP